jgi:Arc/MetJ family transcription regulator
MNRRPTLPWHVESLHRNHAIVGDNDIVVAQRLRKIDAEFIARVVNAHHGLTTSNKQMAVRLASAEMTVAKLRAYIRDGHHESI